MSSKAFLLGILTAISSATFTVTGNEEEFQGVLEAPRAMVPDNVNTLTSKDSITFLGKCVLIAKGLGQGSMSFLCGCCFVKGAKKGGECLLNKNSSLVDKAGMASIALISLVLVAEMGSSSLSNFKEALRGQS